MAMITNHEFSRSYDGRCGYSWGVGMDRERCGNAEGYHAPLGQEPSVYPLDHRTVLIVEVPSAIFNDHYAMVKDMRNRCLTIINEDKYMLLHPSTAVGRF